MPRTKKNEKSKKEENVLDLRQDREEFMRAFEKPTQIYRFLRARHCISPVFLHRTLSYLQDRCSRTNARREVFRVEDLLKIREYKNSLNKSQVHHFDQLKIAIVGFYIDPGVHNENSMSKKLRNVETEVSVRKTLRCRRKDSGSLQTEDVVGAVEIPVNPRYPESFEEKTIILTTSDIQQSSDKQTIKNYSIVFRIYEPQDEYSDNTGASDDAQSDDEAENTSCDDEAGGKKRKHEDGSSSISVKNFMSRSRRRKLNNEENGDNQDAKIIAGTLNKTDSAAPPRKCKKLANERLQAPIYDGDLSIFTSEKKTLLLDGEYELSMNRRNEESGDGRRNATWEALDGGREIGVLSTMNHSPVLKFRLTWSESDKAGPLAESRDVERSKTTSNEPLSQRSQKRATITKKCDSRVEAPLENGNSNKKPPIFPVDLIEYRKGLVNKTSRKPQLNTESNGVEDRTTIVNYQFIYNNANQQQTEIREDFYCPWCQMNCMTLYGLVKHLKISHPRLCFSYAPQDNEIWIEIVINDCYDGSFCGNPQFIFAQPGMAFSRRGPVRRVRATDTLVYRPRKERRVRNDNFAELLEKEERETSTSAHYLAGHHRLYFHSDNNIPVRPCEFDIDSEDETDVDWLRDRIKHMLDEFTDVNEGEKPLMKLWNLYIMKNKCVADAQMMQSCQNFINRYASLIARYDLRRNLLLHLVTLVDFGVLKASEILALMKHFDEIAENIRTKMNKTKDKNGISKNECPPGLNVSTSENTQKSSSNLSEKSNSDESMAVDTLPLVTKQNTSKFSPVKFHDLDQSPRLLQLQKIIDDSKKIKKPAK